MNITNLRELVSRVIDRDWKSFEIEHPMLSQLLDRELLVEHASNRLRDDVEFQKAISDAQAINSSIEFMMENIRPLVRRVIDQLIG